MNNWNFSFNKILSRIKCEEVGQALPMVLVMLTFCTLIIIPSLNNLSANLKAEQIVEKKTTALQTAEAGIEDAIWRIKNGVASPTPYHFTLPEINGLSADVTITEVTTIAGQTIGDTGGHQGWLKMEKSVNYASGIYYYSLDITNNGAGNMKIEQIFMDMPAQVEYVEESTGGNITSDDPTVYGNPGTGIVLFWDLPSPFYNINTKETASHTFQISGPPGVSGIEGHCYVKATREDIGTIWDSDSLPFTITSTARQSTMPVTTLKVGVWKGQSIVQTSCWQIVLP